MTTDPISVCTSEGKQPLPSRSRTNSSIDSESSSKLLGPSWVYGTTTQVGSPSRSQFGVRSSGLCLSERNGGPIAVPQPEVIQNILFPTNVELQQKITHYREKVNTLLCRGIENGDSNVAKNDNPLLVITGPSYVSDSNQIKACAQWIGTLLGKEFSNLPHALLPDSVRALYDKRVSIPRNLLLSVRTNLTKYNRPYSELGEVPTSSIMTFEIDQGIPVCRALLCELAEICPIVGEISDTITPQYLSDLFCLGMVGSTLIESQLHRELVSGISYPIGFQTSDSHLPFDKGMYKHKINAALDAMYACSQPHQFLSVTKIGTVAVVGTIGNEDTFIILQINNYLSSNDLIEFIEMIYNYSKLDKRRPKIMLNVGRISNLEYDFKTSIMKELLSNAQVQNKILGVLVDSGDHYIPNGFNFELNERHPFDSNDMDTPCSREDLLNRQKLIDINRYFVKNRAFMNKELKSSIGQIEKENEEMEYYEYFINADRFIFELEYFSTDRLC
ncbi:hypothetical protein CAAN1_05S04368 [[Candida] anglica]|uniref:3-deoxy-7-phosphoheptulonate synthase n=1 Tax=[Candida] anglica TaxID=148631 RepID=A0ABP0ED13_9ASCO